MARPGRFFPGTRHCFSLILMRTQMRALVYGVYVNTILVPDLVR